MPKLRRYTVRQEVEVKVTASDPTEAAVRSDRILSGTEQPEDEMHIIVPPVKISIEAREDY